MKSRIALVPFTFCFILTNGLTFSENFKACSLEDPEFSACLNEAIANGVKTLGSKGIPSIKVPPIDPLFIKQIGFDSGTTAVQLNQTYNDVSVYGISNLTVHNSNYDSKKKIISFDSYHPQIMQVGKYKLKGKILVIPVFGNGNSTVTLKNATWSHKIFLEEKNKNEKTYFKIVKYVANISVGFAHFDFTNLFNGDKILGDNVLKVTNDNWYLVITDIAKSINKSYGDIFMTIATGLFSNIPISDIFLG